MTAHVGILGGSFDPVHNGHIAIARHCHGVLALECVRLILLNIPAHRKPPLASAGDRLAMLQLACNAEPWLVADDIELKRTGTSYSIDTLDELWQIYPDSTFYFITGQDAFLSIHTWKDWRRLFDRAHFIVLNRTHDNTPVHAGVQAELEKRGCDNPDVIRNRQSGSIMELQIPAMDISSTQIRQNIAAHRPVEGLVPEQVKHYIIEKGLYTQ